MAIPSVALTEIAERSENALARADSVPIAVAERLEAGGSDWSAESDGSSAPVEEPLPPDSPSFAEPASVATASTREPPDQVAESLSVATALSDQPTDRIEHSASNYVYRQLVEANSHHKLEALDDAIKILRYQRETWALLLDQLGKQKATQAAKKLDIPAPSARMEASISMQG